jgi:MATE family multidrug resistance protein
MAPLALSNATSILAAQAIGGGDETRARAWVFAGMRLVMSIAAAMALALFVFKAPLAELYAENIEVQRYAQTLIAMAAICHLLDALQCLLYSSLRAWRITFKPMLVYGVCLWGFGVGAGWWFANTLYPAGPSAAQGFWIGNFTGLAMASLGLWLLLRRAFLNPVLPVKA